MRRQKALQAKPGQHASQQARCNGQRQVVHDALKPACHAKQGDERGADHESAHRLLHAVATSQTGCGQHGGAGRAPSHHHRLSQPQRGHQTAQAHAQAQRPHPGADLLRRGIKRLCRLKHDCHRTGKPHKHRDKAGTGGGQTQIPQKRHQWRLDFDLGAKLHHRVIRQLQKVRGGTGVAVHLGKQLFAPLRHAAANGGDDGVP